MYDKSWRVYDKPWRGVRYNYSMRVIQRAMCMINQDCVYDQVRQYYDKSRRVYAKSGRGYAQLQHANDESRRGYQHAMNHDAGMINNESWHVYDK